MCSIVITLAICDATELESLVHNVSVFSYIFGIIIFTFKLGSFPLAMTKPADVDDCRYVQTAHASLPASAQVTKRAFDNL